MSWQTPWPSLIITVLTAALLVGIGISPVAVVITALVWVGTLYLATSSAPQPAVDTRRSRLGTDTMSEVFEFSGSPLLLTDRNKIVVANSRAREILGEHVLGQDVRVALRHPEAISLLAAEQGGTTTIHGLARRQDIWSMGRQVLENDLAVIELRDKTAEADVGRAHTDFVANASHELRTPLASIIGYVETLSEGDIPKQQSDRFLDTIEREAKRLQNLVNDLMSLSRIEAEKHFVPNDEIDLTALVRRAAKEGAGADRTQRLALDMEDGYRVKGDEGQLEQLVRNLVDNALKYGSADGTVHVTVERGRAGHLRLSIRDEGEGIAREHLPHLTRRFYRTDPGRSRASGGTGLGLAIVKHIVERHRGRLDIESAPGTGTTVSVRLPATALPTEAVRAVG